MRFQALPSGPRRATTSVTPRAPRVEAMGQRVYKPLLGVADTNHLLNIHIWAMLGNVEPLIQVKKWLRGLPDAACHTGIHATTATIAHTPGYRTTSYAAVAAARSCAVAAHLACVGTITEITRE